MDVEEKALPNVQKEAIVREEEARVNKMEAIIREDADQSRLKIKETKLMEETQIRGNAERERAQSERERAQKEAKVREEFEQQVFLTAVQGKGDMEVDDDDDDDAVILL